MGAAWYKTDGGYIFSAPSCGAVPSNWHAVVVIDPEDDAALSRIWRLLPDNLVSIDQLQAALHEFADPTPPKPEEPIGLGAVVEDAEGVRWTRANTAGEWFSDDGDDVATTYADVPAIKVLSEGVTP